MEPYCNNARKHKLPIVQKKLPTSENELLFTMHFVSSKALILKKVFFF